MIRLTALALLILAATAQAQMKRTGEVVFHNDTASPVKVATEFILDGKGARQTPGGSWRLKPHEKLRLLVSGKAIVAHEYHFHLTTFEGTARWKTTCTAADRPGECLVRITEETLKTHKTLASGEKLTQPTSRVRVHNTCGVEMTLTGIYFLDQHGQRQTVKGGAWTIQKETDGHLNDLGQPMPVARFEFSLTTAEGKSNWSLEALPSGADFLLRIDATMLVKHRAAIRDKVTAVRPILGVSDAMREQARARIATAAKEHREAVRREPGDLMEALTLRGGAAQRRLTTIDAQLAEVFPDRSVKERQAMRTVLVRALDGDLRLAKLDEKAALAEITEALKKAGVNDRNEPAAFIAKVVRP